MKTWSSSHDDPLDNLDEQVRTAVQHFWGTKEEQRERSATDQGNRRAVTGGKQMDGFVEIVRNILLASGIRDDEIFYNSYLELPGYYRPEKQWDILVVADGKLIAAMEFKSQSSSFGNNFNNRVEEAVGSSTDLWTAYREGVIPTTPQPWLGYLMLLVETEASTRPIRVREPHFQVMSVFKEASYAERYCVLLQRLKQEKLYQATTFLMTSAEERYTGAYKEPNVDLSFRAFAASLYGQVTSFQKLQG